MSPEELNDMDAKLVKITGHPFVTADDARYAMSCALALIAEVRRLQLTPQSMKEDRAPGRLDIRYTPARTYACDQCIYHDEHIPPAFRLT